MGGGARITHLARRFLGSLSRRPLDPDDAIWVRDVLSPLEHELFERLGRADQKHAAGVARAVAERLGADTSRPVLAAALLHDIGKLESRLGTPGRVLVTVVKLVGGRAGARRAFLRLGVGRAVAYLEHPERGAALLSGVGSAPLTIQWAAAHHQQGPVEAVPAEVADALREADDD